MDSSEASRFLVKHTWLAHVLGVLVLAALVTAVATQFWLSTAGWGFIGFIATMLVAGWFLAAKQPSQSLGWLMMAVTALFALQVPLDLLGQALLPVAPDAAAWMLSYGHDRTNLDTWMWLFPLGLMITQIPLRFPTGQLPSPSWRWFSWYTLGAIIVSAAVLLTMTEEVFPGVRNPVHIAGTVGHVPFQMIVVSCLVTPAIVGSIGSLVVRYRSARAQTRAQIRWVLWAMVIAVLAVAANGFVPPEFTAFHEWVLLLHALVPIAILLAVLRYHLYAIDRIISRTAAYAVVTLLVVGVYALVVTSVTYFQPGLPAIGVALGTLASAALFLPVLRWVQRAVDRRFDRERYDAQRVVEAFGDHLRTAVDLDATGRELIEAVEQTLQPAAVGLWIRSGAGTGQPQHPGSGAGR